MVLAVFLCDQMTQTVVLSHPQHVQAPRGCTREAAPKGAEGRPEPDEGIGCCCVGMGRVGAEGSRSGEGVCLCHTTVQLCPALNRLLLVSKKTRSRWEEGDLGK